MAHAFPPIPARPTFGTLKEELSQSDYLVRKRAKFAYCNTSSYCKKVKTAPTYKDLYLFNKGNYALSLESCNMIPVNKGNLIVGQYSKLNLKDICTVSLGPPVNQPCTDSVPCQPCQNNGPVIVNPNMTTTPFYWSNTIDPLGQLFGSSQCGQLNYTQSMVFNPPNKITLATE